MGGYWKQGLAVLALTAVVGLLCLSPAAAKRPGGGGGDGGGGGGSTGLSYQVIELDSGGGLMHGDPSDINSSRLIVGHVYSSVLDEYFAACWTIDNSGGAVTSTLHLLPGDDAFDAYGVNDHGEIVGEGLATSGNTYPLYWEDRNTAPLVLPMPQGSTYGAAESISNDSVICGWSNGPPDSNGQHEITALVWRVNVEIVNGAPTRTIWGPLTLPAFVPGNLAEAKDIKDSNTEGRALVVGSEWDKTTTEPAALAWTVTSLADGTVTVDAVPELLDLQAQAEGVNNSGLICGDVAYVDAAVWDGTSTLVLDRSATFNYYGKKTIYSARAYAINGNDTIVGSGHDGYYHRAAVWSSPIAPMILLDDFIHGLKITELNDALGINDSGDIVGTGWDDSRLLHLGFLAIPE